MKVINNAQEFDHLVAEGNAIIADFYADWCKPCQALLPTLKLLSKKYEGAAEIVLVNVEDQKELVFRFGIRSVPTLVYFDKQKIVDKTVGVPFEGELEERINEIAKKCDDQLVNNKYKQQKFNRQKS